MARKNNISAEIKDILGKLTIEDLPIKGKRVFIRSDFNVPLDDNMVITDDRRIRSTLPTINYAIDGGAKVILASHLGRPKGKVEPRFSLAPVAKRLQRLLNKEVIFAPDCIGSQVEGIVSKMKGPLQSPFQGWRIIILMTPLELLTGHMPLQSGSPHSSLLPPASCLKRRSSI